MFRSILALAFILSLGLAIDSARAEDAAATPAATDYANPAVWLCRPDRQDACSAPQDATIVAVNGTLTREAFHAAKNPPIDCFYVYPTVSTEPGGNSDLNITGAEKNVVNAQFARFAEKCRLFAPMYRQVTLTALRAMIGGKPIPVDRDLGYNDVLAAWNYYLAHENHGRGVVLVGHSQGSGVLTQLIKADIDGKPAQGQLVSAILMGTALVVPSGGDVGGDFKSIPLCHSATQLGCAIAYSSFRETSPPPDNSRFGRPRDPKLVGMEAACVNPANLSGGVGEAKSYFGAAIAVAGPTPPFPWLKGKAIATPFVSVPGLITASCVHTGPFNYVSVHLNADPASPRTSDIP